MLNAESVQLRWPHSQLLGTVPLSGSKSECNRALLLEALSSGQVSLQNLSDADDTKLMQQALANIASAQKHLTDVSEPILIDVGPAGTTMRFLCAYLSCQPGRYVLKGSERMHQRPIGVLVKALRELGAQITYLERDGFPPLQIEGHAFVQRKRHLRIPGHISSQYLSALLLIAPTLPQGLCLEIEGELTSAPYVRMTLALLERVGVAHTWEGTQIEIPAQSFQMQTLCIEPDWSAASYWYSLLALVEDGEIHLPGLREQSLQGDRRIVQFMKHFGVHTVFADQGVFLKKVGLEMSLPELLDFTECPDIAQTVIVCAAALGKSIRCTGLHTLRIKETDRIAALQKELSKFGVHFELETAPDADAATSKEVYRLDPSNFQTPSSDVEIDTYEDHRMAMAFAPLSVRCPNLRIKDPRVVIKSYPNFWVHLQEMGCSIEAYSSNNLV